VALAKGHTSRASYLGGIGFAFKFSWALYALSYILGLVLRGIPELLSGIYPVGYDTVTYAANILNLHERSLTDFVTAGPLFYILMFPLHYLGPYELFSALKVIGPVLYGFLIASFCFFLSRGLDWDARKSFLGALLCATQIVTLRISWDLFRNELGLIFLFILLGSLLKNDFHNRSAVGILAVLVALSHPLVSVLMFFIVMAVAIKRKSWRTKHFLLPFLPSLLISIFAAIGFATPSTASPRVLYVQAPPFFALYPENVLVIYMIALFLFCYGLLLPFVLIGVSKDIVVSSARATLCIGFLHALTIPISWPSLFWRRYILLLIFPFTVYAIIGFKKLNLLDKHIRILGLLILLFVSVGTAYSSGCLPIRTVLYHIADGKSDRSVATVPFPGQDLYSIAQVISTYIPESMVQSSIPIKDADDLVASLQWINDNAGESSCLLAEERFYPWSLIFLRKDITIIWYPQFYSPDGALKISQEKRFETVYLLWRGDFVSESFYEVRSYGEIRIFQYKASY